MYDPVIEYINEIEAEDKELAKEIEKEMRFN